MQSDKNRLLQQLEEFPPEILHQIFERRFFSRHFGSHYTLFQFRLLLHEENDTRFIREATKAFIQSTELRVKIRTQWNLYRDYDEAVRYRSEFHSNWEQKDDLATSTLTMCGDCFNFLLDCQAILPSYYTNCGLSFFALASRFKNKDIACRLISLMEPEQLLCPKSVGHRETIFQSTVVCNKMFEACWARLESDPCLDISSTLKPKHLYSVCKYASVGLAKRMLDQGLDISIGLATGEGNFTAWNAVAEFHLNPEPMLEWLNQQPSSPRVSPNRDPLVRAVQSDRVRAAIWFIRHCNYSVDHDRAAIEATKRQTDESALILHAIVRLRPLAQPRDKPLPRHS